MFACLLRDQRGAVLSAELVLVLSILVLGVIVGLSEVAVAVNTELNDVSNAIGALDQSYFLTGFRNFEPKCPSHVAGSRFTDLHDDCDKNVSCDLVCGPANAKFGIGGLPDTDTCG